MVGPKITAYKQVGDVILNAHVFRPDGAEPHPCIVWFFCGGWSGFNAKKVYAHCEYLASRGVAGVAAEVRVSGRHKTTPKEAVIDGRSAIRWTRAHAAELGLNPERIGASGSSAAGVLSACTALLDDWNDPADALEYSARPDAVVTFSACLDSAKSTHVMRFCGLDGAREMSPMHHVKPGAPPMLVLHTRDDERISCEQAGEFQKLMHAAGNRCEVILWDKGGHGFFNYWDGKNPCFTEGMRAMDRFLESLGWTKGAPTIDSFRDTQGLVEDFLRNRPRDARE